MELACLIWGLEEGWVLDMASNLGIVSQSSAFHRLDQSKTEALRLTRILESW